VDRIATARNVGTARNSDCVRLLQQRKIS